MAIVIDGNNTPTAGGIGYGDGTELAFTAAGTSGRPIVSGGSGAPTLRPYTLPAADGSANQVLQTDGAGALSFATVGGVTSVATSGGLTGGTITSTGTLSIDTNNSVGVGAYAFVFTVAGGSSVSNGSTTAGSNLNPAGTNNGSFGADTGVTLAGTWRNVSGRTAAGNGSGYGLFIRTA